MVKVTLSAAKRTRLASLPVDLEVPDNATVGDVKAAFADKFPKFYQTRQKLTPASDPKAKALDDDTPISSVGTELQVKDLGPQISWTTVFLVEYAGPLIFHPVCYYLPELVYRGPVQHSLLQQYAYGMVVAHFVKRELETLFVHRFSHATMPARNIFKNCSHYWILSGLALAYPLSSPTYSANSPYIKGTIRDDPRFIIGCFAVWLYAELSNLSTHITLRNLRPAGTRRRGIPYGYGFGWVSCPNYMFETITWTSFAVLTGSWVAYVFLAATIYQMGEWALKKHRNYKKEFGKEYPKGRKAMIPFLF